MRNRTWLAAVLPALLLAGCGDDDGTADAGPMQLTFDGETCVYEGPTEMEPGPVTLVISNESDDYGGAWFVELIQDHTIDDFHEYWGEYPAPGGYMPGWTQTIVREAALTAGRTVEWQGDLVEGTHALVCVQQGTPGAVLFGTEVTVEA